MTTECATPYSAGTAKTATLVEPIRNSSVPITLPSRLYLDGLLTPITEFSLHASSMKYAEAHPLVLRVRVPMSAVVVNPHLADRPECRHVEIYGVSVLTEPVGAWEFSSTLDAGKLVLDTVEIGVYVRDAIVVQGDHELTPTQAD